MPTLRAHILRKKSPNLGQKKLYKKMKATPATNFLGDYFCRMRPQQSRCLHHRKAKKRCFKCCLKKDYRKQNAGGEEGIQRRRKLKIMSELGGEEEKMVNECDLL